MKREQPLCFFETTDPFSDGIVVLVGRPVVRNAIQPSGGPMTHRQTQYRDLVHALWDGAASELEFKEVSLHLGIAPEIIERDLDLIRQEDGVL